MGSPQRLVVDSSVWIDLERGGLLPAAVRLPVQWVASDLVVEELFEPPAPAAACACGLCGLELGPTQLVEVATLRGKYKRTSAADASALVLAKSLGLMLITGNRHLREAAEKEGVDVHGTLWVLDQLVARGIVTGSTAAQALEGMMRAGSRLPTADCRDRIGRWRRS